MADLEERCTQKKQERDVLQEKCKEIECKLNRAETLTQSLEEEQVSLSCIHLHLFSTPGLITFDLSIILIFQFLGYVYISRPYPCTEINGICIIPHIVKKSDCYVSILLFQTRWTETLTDLERKTTSLLGDALLSACCLSYFGPFTPSLRHSLLAKWKHLCHDAKITCDPSFSMEEAMGDSKKVHNSNFLRHFFF